MNLSDFEGLARFSGHGAKRGRIISSKQAWLAGPTPLNLQGAISWHFRPECATTHCMQTIFTPPEAIWCQGMSIPDIAQCDGLYKLCLSLPSSAVFVSKVTRTFFLDFLAYIFLFWPSDPKQ